MPRLIRHAITGLAALAAAGAAQPAGGMHRRATSEIEIAETRPAGEPLMGIVALRNQRITIYDADGWILRAPVSSGQTGYETPAGIYSVLQKEEEHYSNRYDDASMPFMQRITWSGVALHAGPLPGHPASHGCIRMPYDFARRLFEMTKIGMRVIVARDDIRPAEIAHPLLLRPKPVRADIPLEALIRHWDDAGADEQSVSTGSPSSASPEESRALLKSIASDRMAAARAAASKANAARLNAARLTMEALRLPHLAEAAKYRAEAQLRAAQGALEAASSQEAINDAERTKSEALARLEDAQTQLNAAMADAQAKAEGAAHAREEAQAAEAEKVVAVKDSEAMARMLSPVSVFISRKTQRIYVRQAFEPVLEAPVTIRDPAEPIGTHIYTALGYANGGDDLRWSAVSMKAREPGQSDRPGRADSRALLPEPQEAGAALDRIDIPRDVADRIAEVISPGSSLIVSDEGMSSETGKGTDFVILMSDELQGGIKMRRHNPQARFDRPYGRWPAYAPPFAGGLFGPW